MLSIASDEEAEELRSPNMQVKLNPDDSDHISGVDDSDYDAFRR